MLPFGNVRLTPTWPHGFQLSGSGHTSRVPEPQERHIVLRRMGLDWVGNPGLAPSRNTGIDGVFSFRRHGLYLGSNCYLNLVEDYITTDRQQKINMFSGVMNGFAGSYQNVDAKLYGGEMEAGKHA
jgi:iron complex outermembrane receptor protein